MLIDDFVTRFEQNALAISALAGRVDEEQMRWKPSSDDWSILEVINHLYDEERDDFRTRLDTILHRPGDTWPPIHPSAWAVDRRYNERDPEESLANFLAERTISLEWLRGLDNPNWETQATHPAGYVLTAGDMLASWLAHDFLHIRQLNELQYGYWVLNVAPYGVGYAGDW